MSNSPKSDDYVQRPDFLVVLGLIPPVSLADVKAAYLDKAKEAHPDRGGSAEKFVQLQKAFEQASEYARFKAGRMQWLSRWVEQYAEQEQLIEELRAMGAQVDIEADDNLSQTIGQDFATVLDRIVGVKLVGSQFDDSSLVQLRAQKRLLTSMRKLTLQNTSITSLGLEQLHAFEGVRHIDLTGTQVTAAAVEGLLADLPHLESLNITDTGVGWLARVKLRLAHRDVQITP